MLNEDLRGELLDAAQRELEYLVEEAAQTDQPPEAVCFVCYRTGYERGLVAGRRLGVDSVGEVIERLKERLEDNNDGCDI